MKTGDEVEIVGLKATTKTVVTGVEMFRKLLDQGEAGDNVGCLLRGTKREDVERGQVLAKPGSITPHTKFKAEAYILTRRRAASHAVLPPSSGRSFYFRTKDVTWTVTLPEGTEMVMPGRHVFDGRGTDRAEFAHGTRACASPSAKAASPYAPASSPRSSSRRSAGSHDKEGRPHGAALFS